MQSYRRSAWTDESQQLTGGLLYATATISRKKIPLQGRPWPPFPHKICQIAMHDTDHEHQVSYALCFYCNGASWTFISNQNINPSLFLHSLILLALQLHCHSDHDDVS